MFLCMHLFLYGTYFFENSTLKRNLKSLPHVFMRLIIVYASIKNSAYIFSDMLLIT